MVEGKDNRPQGFVVALPIDDDHSRNRSKDHMSKFNGEQQKVFCRPLPLEVIWAMLGLREVCREVEFLVGAYPIGHEQEKLTNFITKYFPGTRVTYIPRFPFR